MKLIFAKSTILQLGEAQQMVVLFIFFALNFGHLSLSLFFLPSF
jgi:hypothetical protein